MKHGHIAVKPLIVFVSFSFLVTFTLAYIDEGNYNFEWITEPGSWAAVLMYVLVFLAAQIFVFRVVLDGAKDAIKLWLAPPIAILMLLLVLGLLLLIS